MKHDDSIKLEHLLLNLVQEKEKGDPTRGHQYSNVSIDADAFDQDSKAIEGLWLAIKLLQEK